MIEPAVKKTLNAVTPAGRFLGSEIMFWGGLRGALALALASMGAGGVIKSVEVFGHESTPQWKPSPNVRQRYAKSVTAMHVDFF